jgi:hypothetical protein
VKKEKGYGIDNQRHDENMLLFGIRLNNDDTDKKGDIW